MDYLTHIIGNSAGFRAALSQARPDAIVPSCPDWTAFDLAHHLTEVHNFWATIIAEDLRTTDQVQQVASPPRQDSLTSQLTALATQTERLIEELARHDDAEVRWSWFAGDQSVGFTRRMQAMEAYQHRVDAELCARLPVTVADPTLAADCVQHCVEVMWAEPWAEFTRAHVLQLTALDTGDSWLLAVGTSAGISPWTAEHVEAPAVRFADAGAPTAQVLGTAHQLACYLWGRTAEVDRSGDLAALDLLGERVSIGND